MKNPFHTTTVPPSVYLPRFTRLMKGMAGIIMALLIQSGGQVLGQTSQDSHQVKLAWNASISKDVTGYRIHIGTTKGIYTTSIVLGNVTSGTVSGLAEGVIHYFAVSAFNAAGLESGYSNEVSLNPGLHTSDILIAANGEAVLSLRGLIGSHYDIEASVDLDTWTLIKTVTIPNGGSLKFSDPDAKNHPRRFYRTRQRLAL